MCLCQNVKMGAGRLVVAGEEGAFNCFVFAPLKTVELAGIFCVAIDALTFPLDVVETC